MRKAVLAAAVLLLAALASANTATGAEPAQTSRFTSSIANVQLPGRYYDLNQNIGDFEPGAALPLQSCACDIYFSVIEGEMTVTIGSETKVYGAGKSGVVPSGLYGQQANRGPAKARVFYTMIKPANGTDVWPFTPASGGTAPSVMPAFSGWSTVFGLHADVDKATLIQDIWAWDAGFKAPLHVMNHDHVFFVLEGEITVRYRDGAVERFTAGQQFVMTVGRPGTMENSGATNYLRAMTMVMASSAPPFSPVEAPAPAPGITLPRTGDAGLASAPDGALTGWAYAAAAFAALGTGALGYALAGRRLARSERR